MTPADRLDGGLAPIDSTSRRDAVLRAIRRAIVVGSLRPGEKLTENRLSASLNVSRPTMREALTQLAQEGLLVQEPYRGLRVADVDATSVRDTAAARVALDTFAVQEILADPTGRRIALVEQAWATYDALPVDSDPVAAHEAHLAFHRALWAAAENSMLLRWWPVTQAHLTIALARAEDARQDPRRAHDEHEALVRAIVARDLDAVVEALRVHTLDAANALAATLTAR